MYTHLYIDPLTGFKNLFSLLECDINNICGDYGTIVVIDMKQLNNVNRTYGMQIGDIYIKSLSTVLKSVLSGYKIILEDISVYRYGGDEFILIFPDRVDFDLNECMGKINSCLKEEMRRLGVQDLGINWAILPYSGRITSIADLLKQSSIAIAGCKHHKDALTEVPQWADELIEKTLLKVRETLQMLQHANKLAFSDEISGLPNHRAATLHLNKVYETHQLSKKPFSILFIDGDNLKKYNELGYECGNRMIRDLATLITSSVRQNDRVFRWLSGDEFIVVLQDTDREAAFRSGERVRAHTESETKSWEYPITISIGVSSCPEDGVTLEDIITKAETANMQAKRTGKNCVL